MKPILFLISLFVCLASEAQSTFVNYRLNFVGGIASTNITIGTNILARSVNGLSSNITGGSVIVVYPGMLPITIDATNKDFLDNPVLGPCTIQFTLQGSAGATALMLIQYDVVNTTLPAQGVIVQPAGSGASISLQTSTNLTTWAAASNGVYPATDKNRFFRMSLALQ